MTRMRLLFLGLATIGITAMPVAQVMASETAGPGMQSPKDADFQRLEGRWRRSDGGYVLELREIGKDGRASATYFNPRPIKVFRAEASRTNGRMAVFVELRDVNYPGSTYRLQYDAATDRLQGTYFQAVEKQTFAVEFSRVRP
ncbi:MAG: hypothetical protein IPP91_09745 [Betaproteobacteria bacterium]|nr:hypothetical protein [Betaproteobacteria bacterium]